MVSVVHLSVCVLWVCAVPVLVGADDESSTTVAPPPPPPSRKPELYFLLMNQEINSVYNLTAVTAVFKRASAAGYVNAQVLFRLRFWYALASPKFASPHLSGSV